MKLVAYLRVSTDVQVERGLGLDVQRKGIRHWAASNGHRVALWTADEGVSGANGIDTRVGLHDALTAIKDRKAAGLVVYRLDRLARKLTIQEATLAKVWDMGGAVFSVDLGEVHQDDPDDPMRTALRQMVGVFAQLERGMIAARLRSGRAMRRDRGDYAGDGSPPFGYKSEPGADGGKVLVPDENYQALLRITELHGAGASLREIAATLTAEGFTPKRSDRWHPESLRRIVGRLE